MKPVQRGNGTLPALRLQAAQKHTAASICQTGHHTPGHLPGQRTKVPRQLTGNRGKRGSCLKPTQLCCPLPISILHLQGPN